MGVANCWLGLVGCQDSALWPQPELCPVKSAAARLVSCTINSGGSNKSCGGLTGSEEATTIISSHSASDALAEKAGSFCIHTNTMRDMKTRELENVCGWYLVSPRISKSLDVEIPVQPQQQLMLVKQAVHLTPATKSPTVRLV